MLALTLAGFVLIAMLPYAAFRIVEFVEDGLDRAAARRDFASFRAESRRAAQRVPVDGVSANRVAARPERVPARH